jgi:hypothetical protein
LAVWLMLVVATLPQAVTSPVSMLALPSELFDVEAVLLATALFPGSHQH